MGFFRKKKEDGKVDDKKTGEKHEKGSPILPPSTFAPRPPQQDLSGLPAQKQPLIPKKEEKPIKGIQNQAPANDLKPIKPMHKEEDSYAPLLPDMPTVPSTARPPLTAPLGTKGIAEVKKKTIVVKRRPGATPPSPSTHPSKPGKFLFKMILAGDGGVGKTALRERYLGRGFSSSYLQTIGADFATTEKELTVDGQQRNVQYQIWDLAGQQEFQGIRGTYYEGCFGAFMVFDITRPASFENIPKWINELWTNSGRGVVPIILLGNKADLRNQFPEAVKDETIRAYVNQVNLKCRPFNFECEYLETSAKTGLNVDNAFSALGINVVKWILAAKR